MNDRSENIKGMLLGAVIGDALATPLDGLSKGHIYSIFKRIESFTDPEPALKGKPQNWKKPGLYSASSQLFLMNAMNILSGRRGDSRFQEFIRELPDSGSGLFRHAEPMFKTFINNAISFEKQALNSYSYPNARHACLTLPLILQEYKSEREFILNLLSAGLAFTRDIYSAAGILFFNCFVKNIINSELHAADIILLSAGKAAEALKNNLGSMSADIFDKGINPDYLISSVDGFTELYSRLGRTGDTDKAEEIIIEYVNTKIKSPVTRTTVNHPLAVIPYTVFFCSHYSENPEEILFRAVEQGGSSVFCMLTGALTGALHGFDWIPDVLMENLINKKRIFNIINSIAGGRISGEIINEFILAEISLTQKEEQELNARLKHVKIKTKKSRKDVEKEITSHIVESWTKFDKAKWRKKELKNYKTDE